MHSTVLIFVSVWFLFLLYIFIVLPIYMYLKNKMLHPEKKGVITPTSTFFPLSPRWLLWRGLTYFCLSYSDSSFSSTIHVGAEHIFVFLTLTAC